MTENVDPPENKGLPKLDNVKQPEKKKKFPFVFFGVSFVVLIGVAYGVQLFITDAEYFDKRVQKIIEPAEPVFDITADTFYKENNSSAEYEVSTLDNATPDNNDEVETESPKSNPLDNILISNIGSNVNSDSDSKDESVNEKISKLLSLVNGLVDLAGKQERELTILKYMIKNGQEHVVSRLTFFESSNRDWSESIGEVARDNSRWLTGISNQLRDIDLNVKNEKESFPLVIYHFNIWGNETYLNVAPKEHPEQTRFMREGEITGRWQLVAINSDIAEFRHFDGNIKKVPLL